MSAKLREARLAQLGKDAAFDLSNRRSRCRDATLWFISVRPAGTGDVDSVAKVDRADLMLAQERFLHSDNAALVVIGGVEKARLMRALRQLLGPWQKADRSVAADFSPTKCSRRPYAAD